MASKKTAARKTSKKKRAAKKGPRKVAKKSARKRVTKKKTKTPKAGPMGFNLKAGPLNSPLPKTAKKKVSKKKAAKRKTKKKIGRPSIYTQRLANTICRRMAEGESLREVCRDPKMPARSTVMLWAVENEKFSDQYAKARELLLEHWADEILDIADDGSNDWEERQNKKGELIIALNHEHVSRSRLRFDARRWLMSKLAPKKYGDKIALTDPDGGPLQVSIVDPTRS